MVPSYSMRKTKSTDKFSRRSNDGRAVLCGAINGRANVRQVMTLCVVVDGRADGELRGASD